MKIQKFGAIDIGSNAMRLLVSLVVEDGKSVSFKKMSLVRLPVRLGAEAFDKKFISEKVCDRFVDGMRAFKYVLKVHGIPDENYAAFATSAMREAENGAKLVDKIYRETGINVEIIDGKREADIIFKAHFRDHLDPECNYIYVDVGGGSTEISILVSGKLVASKSFKIGTIRLMKGMVDKSRWKEMKSWVKEQTAGLEHVEMIGSGGNINKIYKLVDKIYPNPMLYHELKGIKQTLERMSYEQRIRTFSLNPDRADVIVPAAEIYFSVMKWSDSSILHVPKIGLSDGIIQMLYERNKAG